MENCQNCGHGGQGGRLFCSRCRALRPGAAVGQPNASAGGAWLQNPPTTPPGFQIARDGTPILQAGQALPQTWIPNPPAAPPQPNQQGQQGQSQGPQQPPGPGPQQPQGPPAGGGGAPATPPQTHNPSLVAPIVGAALLVGVCLIIMGFIMRPAAPPVPSGGDTDAGRPVATDPHRDDPDGGTRGGSTVINGPLVANVGNTTNTTGQDHCCTEQRSSRRSVPVVLTRWGRQTDDGDRRTLEHVVRDIERGVPLAGSYNGIRVRDLRRQ